MQGVGRSHLVQGQAPIDDVDYDTHSEVRA